MKASNVLVFALVLALPSSCARAYTLTFDDDLPPGGTYGSVYDIHFICLNISDHASSPWGPPHSGDNVLTSLDGSWSKFYFKDQSGPATSIGAFFSTAQDAVVRMECYQYVTDLIPIACADIGAPGESWNNVYLHVSPSLPFETVVFRPVSSYDALLYFCLDDLTVVPVPEPTSLLVLAAGLAPMILRRRR